MSTTRPPAKRREEGACASAHGVNVAPWLYESFQHAEDILSKLSEASLGPAGRLLRHTVVRFEAFSCDEASSVELRAIEGRRPKEGAQRTYREPPLVIPLDVD